MATSLQFPLPVEEDWPPVGSESLPFEKRGNGYELLVPPLFVSDLSVNDIIEASVDEFGFVSEWKHVQRSKRSVVWILRISDCGDKLQICLERLRGLGCNTTGVEGFGCYAVDVPESVRIGSVDEILNALDENEAAVAFPSMRHPE